VLTGFGNLSTLKSIKNLLKPPAGHIPYQQDSDFLWQGGEKLSRVNSNGHSKESTYYNPDRFWKPVRVPFATFTTRAAVWARSSRRQKADAMGLLSKIL